MGFRGYTQSWMKDIDEDFLRANVISVEMEAATIFTLANLYGLRAGCICSIIDLIASPQRNDTETQAVPIGEALKPKPEFIRAACECAVKAVQLLNKWDHDREAKGKKNWYPSLSYGRGELDT
jgi:uridine phosphorylase